MDEHEKNPVSFQPGDGVRAFCSRLSRSCWLSPGLPPSSTLCAAVVHSDAARARFSLSFWLISTGSVCLTRQEREKLLLGWMVDEVDWGGGCPQGTSPLRAMEGVRQVRRALIWGGLIQQFLQTNSFSAFFPFYPPLPNRNDITLGIAFHFSPRPG